MKLTDLPATYRIAVLGESGSGKTRLVGTLCNLMSTVVVTGDAQGLDTLRSMGAEPTELVWVEDWAKVLDYTEMLAKAVAKAEALAIDDFGSVQRSALESVTSVPRGRDEERMERAALARQRREQALRGSRRLEYQQWGALAVATSAFLTEVKRMPTKVLLVTLLEDVRPHPRHGRDVVFPDVLGRIRSQLLAGFSLVGYCYKWPTGKEVKLALTCQDLPNVPTKSRYGVGRTWVIPDMAQVLKYASGKDQGESTLAEKDAYRYLLKEGDNGD